MNQTQELCLCHMMAEQPQSRWQSPPRENAGQATGETLPLALLNAGTGGRISFLRGKADTIRHLTELGFVEGAEIKVVSGNLGNLIVELKGSRLALGRQIAAHIVVTR